MGIRGKFESVVLLEIRVRRISWILGLAVVTDVALGRRNAVSRISVRHFWKYGNSDRDSDIRNLDVCADTLLAHTKDQFVLESWRCFSRCNEVTDRACHCIATGSCICDSFIPFEN